MKRFFDTNTPIDKAKCIALSSIGVSYLAKFVSVSLLHLVVLAFLIRYRLLPC